MLKRNLFLMGSNKAKGCNLGFSLLELLVAVSIFITVSVIGFNIYLGGNELYQKGERNAELLQNGRVILERVIRETRQAKEIATPLSALEAEATSTIIFEDGHTPSLYNYIHYFKEDDLAKREVIGYYFSGDTEKTLVPWNSEPPAGQTLETKVLVPEQTIGEYVEELKIWQPDTICISLRLRKNNREVPLRTKISARNI